MKPNNLAMAPIHRIPQGRLLGIDLLRAIAILGMVWIHFSLTGWWDPGPGRRPDDAVVWLNHLLDVRSRDIFFLLAGVSVALMTGGHTRHRGREMATSCARVGVRAVVLLLFALTLGELDAWEAQILHFYALWLVLLLPLSVLPARALFAICGVLAVAAPVFKIFAVNHGLFEPSIPTMMRLSQHPGFALLLRPGDWLPTLQNVVFGAGSTSQDTIAVLPFLVLGLALGRLDLRDHAVRVRMLVTGAATACGAVLVSLVAMYPLGAVHAVNAAKRAGHPLHTKYPWQELVTMGHPGPAIDLYSIVGSVFMMGLITAMLGGLLAAMQHRIWRRVLWPLTAFGSMALTWYFVHFQVLAHAPFTSAKGTPTNRSVLVFAACVLAALAFSLLWRRWFSRGPLEWLQHRAITSVVPKPTGRRGKAAEPAHATPKA